MAKVVTEKYSCDVCKAEIAKPDPRQQQIQVIFTTEQTEGRSCKPYLSNQTVDLCVLCHEYMLEGNYIFANGAMGYNNYNFKEKRK